MENKKVWFVTGASQGLGLALVKRLLRDGYRVAATSRHAETLAQAVATASANFLPLQVDLESEASIGQAIKSTHEHFGCIDVVVNNAGFGIGGAVEELSQAEIRSSFEVNVFATIMVIQQVMPYLRTQRSGHIINVSSIAGFSAGTGWSIYAATKFAVVGLTEVLADDVKSLGIHATVVEPGAFRTNFLTENSLTMTQNIIPDYTTVRESHAKYAQMNGTQIGDPDKAAEAFIQLAENPTPPVRLFLGSDAYRRAAGKIDILQQDLENWKDLTLSTDFN